LSLEGAWQRATGGNEFARRFEDLWNWNAGRSETPLLIFNVTNLELSLRYGISPSEGLGGQRLVPDLMRLSTAAFLSSRYPYVTPAGRYSLMVKPAGHDPTAENPAYLPRSLPGMGERGDFCYSTRWHGLPCSDRQVHYADGGYSDNSGILGLAGLLTALSDTAVKRKVRPILVEIGPMLPGALSEQKPNPLGGGVLGPLLALFGTSQRHTGESINQINRDFSPEGSSVFAFSICPVQGESVPLGWLLSARSRRALQKQAVGSFQCSNILDFGEGLLGGVQVENNTIMRHLSAALDSVVQP